MEALHAAEGIPQDPDRGAVVFLLPASGVGVPYPPWPLLQAL